jgi:hypothetical protein
MYQDKNGLWHDKPNRISNNVYIYGLYAKLLGFDVSKYPEYFQRCVVKLDRNNITINRHAGKPRPPLSFDELIGMVGLGLMPYDALKGNHFVYFGHGEPLHKRFFEKLVKAMLEYVKPRLVVKGFSITIKTANLNDRNRWWRENLENVKHFAVRLTPAMTYVVKRFYGHKPHEEERLLWNFYRDCTTKKKAKSHGDYSQKNLLWALHLMNGDEKRAKELKPWVNFEKYFGASHPFTGAIKKKYGVK